MPGGFVQCEVSISKILKLVKKNIENLVKILPILLRTEEKERAARWFCPM